MSHNQYPNPESAEFTPLEELKQCVDGMLPLAEVGDSVQPSVVTRYVGGDAHKLVQLNYDPTTGDCAIDFSDTAGAPAGALAHNYSFKNSSVLTREGKLIDTSGDNTPDGYDHEKSYAPVLLDALRYSSDKPLRTIGKLMLLRRVNKQFGNH